MTKTKITENEQAKELIALFYPGSEVQQDFGEFMDGNDNDDWRWEMAKRLSIKCCEKILMAIDMQRIQSLDVIEYWEKVKQLIESK